MWMALITVQGFLKEVWFYIELNVHEINTNKRKSIILSYIERENP